MERDAETRKVYAATLRNLLYSNTLPNGKQADMPVSAASQFTVADVDADGKEELVLLIESENSVGYIIGYNSETKNIYTQLEEFPSFTFLKNGNLKALSSHNQTWGEMWPYTLYQYLPESDSYELRGYVYSEDKTFLEENDLIEHYSEYADTSGTGTVYYVGTNTWGTTPIDEADYIAWLEENNGNAAELTVEYLPLTEESILTIEYYDNSTDAESASPEQYGTETGNFENIMGFSGYWTQQIGITCGRTYYTYTAQGLVPIAESFGYEIDDHVCDLDSDGTPELICNVTYGFNAAERIYVYRLHDDMVERGYIEEEAIFAPSDIWGVGAIAERYDAAQKKLLLTLTKEDGSTQTHEQSDYTHFVWEKYADIIAASSGQ